LEVFLETEFADAFSAKTVTDVRRSFVIADKEESRFLIAQPPKKAKNDEGSPIWRANPEALQDHLAHLSLKAPLS